MRSFGSTLYGKARLVREFSEHDAQSWRARQDAHPPTFWTPWRGVNEDTASHMAVFAAAMRRQLGGESPSSDGFDVSASMSSERAHAGTEDTHKPCS